jgi:cytochrome c
MRLLGVIALAAMLLAGIGAALGSVADAANLHGDAARGAKVYERCEGCHSLDANRVGPKHRGVVGREAGAVSGYDYSPALAGSGIVWDEAKLDAWLANPAKLVPGTKMGFRLKDAQDRADVIVFLKAQGGE